MNIINSILQFLGLSWFAIPIIFGGLSWFLLWKFLDCRGFNAFTIGTFIAIVIVFIMIFKGCTPVQISTTLY